MMSKVNGVEQMPQVINIGTPGKFENMIKATGFKLSTVLVVLAVSGCASFQRDHFTVGSVPGDYRTKHPIVVSQSEVKTDILVASSMRGMNLRIQNTVTEFVGRYKRSGADSLRIVIPSGSHNETAARAVSGDIVNHARSLGVNPSRINIERYHASNHGDAATLRLSYHAVSAKVHSECGQWNEDLLANSENINYANFGCATQNNLAELIANPEDLITPRGQSEIDATRRDNVINDWRDGGSPALPSLL